MRQQKFFIGDNVRVIQEYDRFPGVAGLIGKIVEKQNLDEITKIVYGINDDNYEMLVIEERHWIFPVGHNYLIKI